MISSHFIQGKRQNFTRSYISLHVLPSLTRHSQTSFAISLALANSTLGTSFSALSELSQVNSDLEFWYWLIPLPRMHTLGITVELSFTSIMNLLKCHILNEIYRDHLIWNYNRLPHPPSTTNLHYVAPFFSIFFHEIYRRKLTESCNIIYSLDFILIVYLSLLVGKLP